MVMLIAMQTTNGTHGGGTKGALGQEGNCHLWRGQVPGVEIDDNGKLLGHDDRPRD